MVNDNPNPQIEYSVPGPNPDLKSLDRLVGTWQGWPAYAIPGPDNIFVQRRSGIVLTADTGAT